ncbi:MULTISPECIES: hypothetical protein [unclassified Collinsella]|uniref:hypothetical protein n=1 Tax=unclassified Collinsella TaxID=2637548 RepID=UPI001314FE6E|nr:MULTISPECIES: hypothetical protein [unclassified Collinsella]
MAEKLRTASHYAATSLPLNYLIEISKAIDALSSPLAIPLGQKMANMSTVTNLVAAKSG